MLFFSSFFLKEKKKVFYLSSNGFNDFNSCSCNFNKFSTFPNIAEISSLVATGFVDKILFTDL